MKRKLDYDVYADKVRGCFLGKTVIGTLGAPYEGTKMPMDLVFQEKMIDTMLPNDDLDLQVLWLDTVEKYGPDFTPVQLQQAFAENCDYSPGEYAVMRKNYRKGIYPPYSGMFCNDFYREGMGCPIRSEIWACLAPGEPETAAALASRDGILDHSGESVYAERFFAAMEAEAFFESDFSALIAAGLSVIPETCRFRTLVQDVVAFCKARGEIRAVLADILFRYGHPDCTNLFQNMGITLAALLLGETDMIRTGMAALNCGFDTDCTCASAGALLGILHGERKLKALYGWENVRYVLGVRSHRRSDLVSDLADDVAELGAALAGSFLRETVLTGKLPQKTFVFAPKPELSFAAEYEHDDPSVGIGKDCAVRLLIQNNTASAVRISDVEITATAPIRIKESGLPRQGSGFSLAGGECAGFALTVGVPVDCRILPEHNRIRLSARVSSAGSSGAGGGAGKTVSYEFGVSGNKMWKLTGPIWKTESAAEAFAPAQSKAEETDRVRLFHLNFLTDPETEFFTEEELFAPLGTPAAGGTGTGKISYGGSTLFARPYRETFVQTAEDAFELKDLMGFQGPCVVYLSQILISPEDREVDIQLGHSAPFRLFVNGKRIGERCFCDQWTAENAHFEKVRLLKGENRIVLRLTRVNRDAKFSLIYSDGLSCASHYCDFATKRI